MNTPFPLLCFRTVSLFLLFLVVDVVLTGEDVGLTGELFIMILRVVGFGGSGVSIICTLLLVVRVVCLRDLLGLSLFGLFGESGNEFAFFGEFENAFVL